MKRAIKMDSSLKAEFLDDPAFDAVWESFEETSFRFKLRRRKAISLGRIANQSSLSTIRAIQSIYDGNRCQSSGERSEVV